MFSFTTLCKWVTSVSWKPRPQQPKCANRAASGVVEPIAALVTILLLEHLLGIFPYLLAFAAGAMIYVVVEELIPESHSGRHSNTSTIGFAIGFALMMVLDVALG